MVPNLDSLETLLAPHADRGPAPAYVLTRRFSIPEFVFSVPSFRRPRGRCRFRLLTLPLFGHVLGRDKRLSGSQLAAGHVHLSQRSGRVGFCGFGAIRAVHVLSTLEFGCHFISKRVRSVTKNEQGSSNNISTYSMVSPSPPRCWWQHCSALFTHDNLLRYMHVSGGVAR